MGNHGKKDVDIVFEHPGESTFPVSTYLVKTGGMVVICAGTSGYNLTMDARYVWMRQKGYKVVTLQTYIRQIRLMKYDSETHKPFDV